MKQHKKALASIFFFIALFNGTSASAELSFDGYNRFILNAPKHRKTIEIKNEGSAPALAHITIKKGGDESESSDIPMAITAPALAIPANNRKSFDVIYQGQGLPDDRESYFLLSVLDVPTKPSGKDNVLQIALRHNFKLFYRPKLAIAPDAAIEQLRWTLANLPNEQGRHPKAHNGSPYHLTLTDVQLITESGESCKLIEHVMLSPFSTYDFSAQHCSRAEGAISYNHVTDGGREVPFKQPLETNF